MSYELSFEYYQGPIEKLLDLIEEKKLEITRFALAEVTEGFFAYLETLERSGQTERDPHLLADFLVVASKLLLIKSKALLPALELEAQEEEETKELEARLRLYQEFRHAKQYLREAWHDMPESFSREFLMLFEPFFYPPRAITANALRDALSRLTEGFQAFLRPTEIVKREIVNIKQKIEEVLHRLTETPLEMRMLRKGEGKHELVVLFLAVLHLIKAQLIEVEQKGRFEEIMIAKKNSTGYHNNQ